MKGIILDKRIEEDSLSTCYLSKINLADYVKSLPKGYKEYEVQREIVKNTYLDNLVETVLNRRHIPPIVLIVEKENFTKTENDLNIDKFKILDGLQRTFRLKLIWDTIELFKSELSQSKEILELKRIQLSRKFSTRLEEINSNSKVLESIIKYYNIETRDSKYDISDCFNVNQWFEIWTGLTPEQEVSKMLILNAGHKPVKTKHQLELLFRSLIPVVKSVGLDDFELIREKDMSSIVYSKNRIVGQFHFSHIITSILSLNEGKPLTSNVALVHKTQSQDFDFDKFDKYFSFEFLHKFIESLLELDRNVESQYGELGIKWIGREISLVGIFAALGKYSNEHHIHPTQSIDLLEEKITNNPEVLQLEDFEYLRNRLDLSKINIGSVNKKAVYEGVYAILSGNAQSISWSLYFKGVAL
jgi:hypothetical protein